MTKPALAGRIVLITGASSGLGRHFVFVAAQAGAKVALAARRREMIEELADELRAQGAQAAAVALDVTDEASVIAGFAAAADALGPIDTVIANAGIAKPGLVLDAPTQVFDDIMNVNCRGAFLTAREGGRHMIANGVAAAERGRIVIVASVGGMHVLPGQIAYSVSKAAAIMLGKGLAREWARKGINVNVLCPGYVETDINRHWFASEGGQKQINGFLRRRVMQEDDLTSALLYLTGDGARAVTGSVVTVDDGQYI